MMDRRLIDFTSIASYVRQPMGNHLKAIVRAIPDSFALATTGQPKAEPIDVENARRQHRSYVRAFLSLGVDVTELPHDNRFPDCCFVEDQAIVCDDLALITRSGLASRRGEANAIAGVLETRLTTIRMASPACLDGGDVLRVNDCLIVGLSGRTNDAGVAVLREVFEPHGLHVRAIMLGTTQLHLKCVCSAVTNNLVVAAEHLAQPSWFEPFDVLWIPREEGYACNLVGIGHTVLIPAGFPKTREILETHGFRTVVLENSEIRKADGALTCCSILYE